MERHAVVFLEVPSNAGRIDRFRAQVAVADTHIRRALDLRKKIAHPNVGLIAVRRRPAHFARPIPRAEGVGRACEELDILALRLAGRAGRPAEDACGFHRDHEDARVGCVARQERFVHLFFGWERSDRHGFRIHGNHVATVPPPKALRRRKLSVEFRLGPRRPRLSMHKKKTIRAPADVAGSADKGRRLRFAAARNGRARDHRVIRRGSRRRGQRGRRSTRSEARR